MKNLLVLITILCLFLIINCEAQSKKEIDNYIAEIQKQYNIPGLALAVIRNGDVIHKNNYGVANIELSVPVTDKTVFPLFSTSKVMSVIAVYQLIEQKRLSLDNYISEFLIDLPKTWQKVQIINLITHSSGLPDIVGYSSDSEEEAKQKVYKDSIKFAPNKRFDYNQTNFWLINRIFQKLVEKSLSTYILDNQFQASLQPVVYEGNNMKLVKNLSYGYVYSTVDKQFFKRNWSFPEFLYGAAALNMTLESFIEWNNRLDNNEFISASTKEQLFMPYKYEEPRNFTYGLDLILLNGEASYGFSGGVSTAFRKFRDKNLTIILLANGQFLPTDKLNGINEAMNNIARIADQMK
jgi:CubicO group peptidase (beta-lactamase class C family)